MRTIKKTCTQCAEAYPATADYFYVKNLAKTTLKLRSECKKCSSKYKSNTPEHLEKRRLVYAEWVRNNPDKMREAGIRHRKKYPVKRAFTGYRNNAKHANRVFDLTYEDFRAIVSSPCTYCGLFNENGFNGIDRKNNAEGYTLQNSMPCCTTCNFLKGTFTAEQFMSGCLAVVRHNNLMPNAPEPIALTPTDLSHNGTLDTPYYVSMPHTISVTQPYALYD